MLTMSMPTLYFVCIIVLLLVNKLVELNWKVLWHHTFLSNKNYALTHLVFQYTPRANNEHILSWNQPSIVLAKKTYEMNYNDKDCKVEYRIFWWQYICRGGMVVVGEGLRRVRGKANKANISRHICHLYLILT